MTSPNASKPDSFTAVQYNFTRHIRDPEGSPAPLDIEERRMEIYRGLLYRNVESFMANGFPVLRRIIPDEQWHEMIREYFKKHQARTPLFPRMTREFLLYLEQEQPPFVKAYPFLQELAHYEWVEVELSLDTREIASEGYDQGGDLLTGVPVVNELILPLTYRYPVHRLSPDYLPEEPPEQPTYLLVYRNRRDEIGFMELNPVSARLMELLQQDSGCTGRELLQQIAEELQHPKPEVVIEGGLQIMETMREKEILLGVRE